MKKNLLVLTVLSIVCSWMGMSKAYALDQIDGVYQIGTPQDLVDFSALVNNPESGAQAANAVLTSDLDMTTIEGFTPIGTTATIYKGTFDGQEHIISNLFINLPEQEYVGLFGVLGDGAYIKNLIMDNLCEVSGKCFVGGIAGGTNGGGSVTFENCGNAGMVGAQEQNAAGIIGVSMMSQCSIRLINCFNTGGIAGDRECAALCGWVGDNGSVIQNCYNAGWISGVDGTNTLWRNGNGKGTNNFDSYGNQGTLISENELDLASGSVCYQMNGNKSENVIWYQRIGVDAYPVPFASHGVVYAVGDLYCDGTSKGGDMTFSNTNESNRDAHQFMDGICTNCGEVDVDFLQAVDGFYQLGTAVDLNWFAAMVNKGHKKMNARLTADINFTEYTAKSVMIGGEANNMTESAGEFAYEGIFDGQNHKITINYNATWDGVALFGTVENTTIRNLVIEGSIAGAQRFMGGLGYVSRGTCLYENIMVTVDIAGTYPGDATNGGLFAVCHESPTFRNCAFVGSMNCPDSEGSAAIIGYAHGRVETTIENCYVAPASFSLTGNSTVIARNVNNVVNCFYTDNVDYFIDEATAVPVASLPSGELCYLINKVAGDNVWRQNLGEDSYPVPFESHKIVYANGSLNCDGTPGGDITYSNDEGETQRPDHQYVNDICTVCGARIIRNAQQLVQLADDVNNGVLEKSIIVDLAADINLNGVNFSGIGCRYSEETGEYNGDNQPIMRDVKRPFLGTFDGHGYRISNMLIESMTDGNKGLFGVVKAGSTIKNVTVSGEIYSVGYSGGIVGTSIGKGTLTIENCGSEVMVNVGVDGANGAGILGVNDLSEAVVRIINCYSTGDIVGQRECGNISGWLGDRAEVINCYASGIVNPEAVDGSRTFARYNGNNVTFTNCYEVLGMQDNIGFCEYDDLGSGKLCFLINQGAGETVFYQTLNTDEWPVLDATHGVVYEDGLGGYTNTASGIEKVTGTTAAPKAVFSLSGTRQQQMQRGINIVRMENGNVVKVLVK